VILSAQTIRRKIKIAPWSEQAVFNGLSYGLGAAGYDIRVAESVHLRASTGWALASAMEHIVMPSDVVAMVHDKSTWARRGLAVQTTTVEPGWQGFLTLELSNHGPTDLMITAGTPIAKLVFHLLDQPTEQPYDGKYQGQGPGPQPAR
jgi:dCTP deaminase